MLVHVVVSCQNSENQFLVFCTPGSRLINQRCQLKRRQRGSAIFSVLCDACHLTCEVGAVTRIQLESEAREGDRKIQGRQKMCRYRVLRPFSLASRAITARPPQHDTLDCD